MVSWLKNLREWATRRPVYQYSDPVLGELIICDTGWEAAIDGPEGSITIAVGGRYEPDPALLKTAHATAGRIEAFTAEVKAYLRDHCASLAGKLSEEEMAAYREEVEALRIQTISYWWPKRPNCGMIFFNGSDECKCWRCDIEDGTLCGLNLDT